MSVRYQIQTPIAFGAQARVFRALDAITGKPCLLKMGPSVREEALLAMSLNHPSISKPYDVGIDSETSFAAYVETGYEPLHLWRKKNNVEDLRRVCLQIAEFLSFLHHKGWLYNDFKAEHFLVGDDDLKVLDLGLCTPLNGSRTFQTSTFSGTFPYISPERLAGRPIDQRSDIFALGMMLLHLFFPGEDWTREPSFDVLRALQVRAKEVKGFWRDILLEMTAIEPSQRIASGHELWEKLLPRRASKSFLFFPVASRFSLTDTFLKDKRALVYLSPSKHQLQSVEDEALASAWQLGFVTFQFDLDQISVEEAFRSLGRILLKDSPKDPFSLVHSMKEFQSGSEILLVFRKREAFRAKQKSFLAYCFSCLCGSSRFHFLLTTTHAFEDSDENCEVIRLPALKENDLEEISRQIFPSQHAENRIRNLTKKEFSTPEEIMLHLGAELPRDYFFAWPSAAKKVRPVSTLEQLSLSEKRLLAALAIAGGSLPYSSLLKIHSLRMDVFCSSIEKLLQKAVVARVMDRVSLQITPSSVLRTVKRRRITEIASTILVNKHELIDLGYTKALYCIARNAGRQRLCAAISLRNARQAWSQGRGDESMEWYWNSFCSKAWVPYRIVVKMIRHNLHHSEMRKVQRLLRYSRKRYRLSYSLASLYLDYYHRRGLMARAAAFCKRIVEVAASRGHKRAQLYFSLSKAGFCIQAARLDEGEGILRNIERSSVSLSPCNEGLLHHFLGLAYFYRRHSSEAMHEFRLAVRKPHPLRSSSFMNLGIVLATLGELDRSERVLQHCIRIFSRQGDADCLAHAYHNLGIVCKLHGRIDQARANYFRGLHLAKAGRNVKTLAMILEAIEMSFALEGRTGRAIYYGKKALRYAGKLDSKALTSTCLTNLGLQLGIQGKFQAGLRCLREAVRIRKDLGLGLNLANPYESMGLIYLFSKQYKKAISFFQLSSGLFIEAKQHVESYRLNLFLSLALIRTRQFDRVRRVLDASITLKEGSFEKGLRDYVQACLLLQSSTLDCPAIRECIYSAEATFRKTPALFWLAKAHQLKAEYLMRTDHYERAVQSIQQAYDIFLRLGARHELFALAKGGTPMKIQEKVIDRMAEKLPQKILLMIRSILAEQNSERMISKILTTAIEFTEMERAVLILKEEPMRIFRSAALDEVTIEEIRDISQSATKFAADARKPFISMNVASNPYLQSKPSILANRITSIVCLPLWAEDNLLGYLYLDSREGVESLAASETLLLEIFASIIAMTLNTNLTLERSLEQNDQFRTSLGLKTDSPQIIGNSKPILDVMKSVHHLLDSDIPVLITGETGTGKELIARVLHFCGKRKNGPFVAVNCSALTETLLESELFGHEKGSFTGAATSRRGLFEEANNGTILLDEIGDMSRSMQVKFLRVLQDGEFRRVGGNTNQHTNARILLATNRNLPDLVEKKEFREDLYYRIKGAQIVLPPLRERREDIPILAAYFLNSCRAATRKKIRGFRPEAIELMKKYSWSGNIRQLKFEIERIVALTEQEWITASDFDPAIQQAMEDTPASRQIGTLQEIEKLVILERLEATNWNVRQAARSLGLTRNGLYGKMRAYNISRKDETVD